MQVGLWVWALFAFLVTGMLAVDLLVFRGSRGEGREPAFRSAAPWSAAWISPGFLFSVVVRGLYGPHAQLTHVTAYLLEKSLSVDNIFVFVLIFSQLRIPPREQRRILYGGVLGALVGGKMLLDGVIAIPTWVSLVVVAGALGLAVMASVMVPPRPAERAYSR